MSKHTYTFLLLVICFFGFITKLYAQDATVNDKIDAIVHQKMKEYNIPGLAIGVLKDSSFIYTKGYGVATIGTKNTISENSIFHTASISKLFTGVAIMELVQDEKLNLDNKLVDLIPELPYKDERIKEITVKQLLNHTSGLPDVKNYHWERNNLHKSSLNDYILNLTLTLRSEPSTQYYYSNLGYDILGLIIEKASGISFEDYLKDNILSKNNMSTSDFRYFKIPDSLKTSPHSQKKIGNKVYVRKTYPYTREHAPSSTLNASVKELSNWMHLFLNEYHSNPKSMYHQMTTPSTDLTSFIGLGFQLYNLDNYKAVGHFGGDKGFRSFLMLIPEKKIGLVVLGNCDYHEDYRQEILKPIAKLLLETL